MNVWKLLFYIFLSTKHLVKNTKYTNPGTEENQERNNIPNAYNNQLWQLTEFLIDSNQNHQFADNQNANGKVEQYAGS